MPLASPSSVLPEILDRVAVDGDIVRRGERGEHADRHPDHRPEARPASRKVQHGATHGDVHHGHEATVMPPVIDRRSPEELEGPGKAERAEHADLAQLDALLAEVHRKDLVEDAERIAFRSRGADPEQLVRQERSDVLITAAEPVDRELAQEMWAATPPAAPRARRGSSRAGDAPRETHRNPRPCRGGCWACRTTDKAAPWTPASGPLRSATDGTSARNSGRSRWLRARAQHLGRRCGRRGASPAASATGWLLVSVAARRATARQRAI